MMERQFKRFAIHTSRATQLLDRRALFQRVLSHFLQMPVGVRDVHSPDPASDLDGEVLIEGAETWPGRVIAWLFGFPRGGENLPASVTIEADGDGEVWVRRFGNARFSSHLSAGREPNQLCERFGPFAFD